MKSTWSQALESGNAHIAIQINSKRHPDLINVLNAVDLAKTDEARPYKEGHPLPGRFSRNYSLPPGTPKERVTLLQKAVTDYSAMKPKLINKLKDIMLSK